MGFMNLFKKKVVNESLLNLTTEVVTKMPTIGVSIGVPAEELSLQDEIKASDLLTELLAIDIKVHYWYDAAVYAGKITKDEDPELYEFSYTYEKYVNEFVDIMDELKILGFEIIFN